MTSDSPGSNDEEAAKPKVPRRRRGNVSITPERCKGCGYCVEFCPSGVLGMSPAFNAKGYHYPQVVNPDNCSGCDLCGMYCPDFAICGGRLPKLDPV